MATTRKPATTRRPAARTKPKAAPKPKTFVTADDVLHWTASDGTEIAISLRCKTKVFRELENLNDLGAFFRFLDAIGDEKTAAQVDELDILDTTTLVEEWGDALAERVSRAIGQPVTAGE